MNRVVLGALAALLLVAAGLFWLQGRAATKVGDALPDLGVEATRAATADALPIANAGGKRGPAPPVATEATKEQRRFDRLDRDRDDRITRTEMLSPRVPAFRKLDANGDNLLTFEEWSVRTGNRFKAADSDGDGTLSRPEYATTKPRAKAKAPTCRCPAPAAARKATSRAPSSQPEVDLSDEEGDEPVA